MIGFYKGKASEPAICHSWHGVTNRRRTEKPLPRKTLYIGSNIQETGRGLSSAPQDCVQCLNVSASNNLQGGDLWVL